MSGSQTTHYPHGPLLLCFDGSSDAAAAITHAGYLFSNQQAVVLTVWEPMALWARSDPATIVSAPLDKLASRALGVDDALREVAQELLERGVGLAQKAGFTAEGRLAAGKPWRAICEVADRLDAEAIVVGARGLSRVKSALLGSVSFAVVTHAGRPVVVVPHVDQAQ